MYYSVAELRIASKSQLEQHLVIVENSVISSQKGEAALIKMELKRRLEK